MSRARPFSLDIDPPSARSAPLAFAVVAAVCAAAAAGGCVAVAADQGAPLPPEPAGPTILAVVGGTLIDGTGADPIPDSAILVEGDRIQAAGPRRQIRIPPGAVAVDATDLTVIPGLIDMHVHLSPEMDLSLFLSRGVTTVRHLGDLKLPDLLEIVRRVEADPSKGPRIHHCGLFVVSEPPFKPEAYPPEDRDLFLVLHEPAGARALAEARTLVARLVDAGADVVKVKTEMSPEGLKVLGAAAAEAGLPITFDNGGEKGSYDAMTAFEAGARGVEHLTGIPFDDPAAVDRALKTMIDLRVDADPTFVVLDRTFAATRVAQREAFVRRFVAAGGSVIAGTDVPTRGLVPGASLHQELERLVAAGLAPRQALHAATGAAGRALGCQGLVGTIEAGAYADFLIVAGDPEKEIRNADRIFRIFKGGVEYVPGGEATEPATPPAAVRP